MTSNDAGLADSRGINAHQLGMLRRTRGMTSAAVEAIPEATLRRALRRLDYPDLPRAREAFRLVQGRDAGGGIPPRPELTAMRQLDSMRVRARTRAVAGVPTGTSAAPQQLGLLPTPATGIAQAAWVPLGPGNIGGRTRSIAFHPTQPDTVWAASAGGGVWRTDDAGASWQPVDDLMANLAVTSLAIDPTNPDILYAGTGEGFFNIDAIRGAGIFCTTDGSTWTHLASTSDPRFESVNRLALDATGTVLLAGGNGGLMRSDDPSRATWATTLSSSVADVVFHPTDPTRAVAGSGAGGSGAVWSSSDAGATWVEATHATAWQGRVEVAYAAANPDIVYASLENNNGEVWRSTDGGLSFTRRDSLNADGVAASYLGDQGWYGNAVWAGDPTDSDLLVVGGVDLWRSTDGGNTLQDMSTWWSPDSAHADHHAIASHPGYDGVENRIVLFGNDGGIYRAGDVRTVGNDPQPPRVSGWENLNHSYGVTQFFAGAVNSNGVVIGGAQDNGTLALHPQAAVGAWSAIFGGDGGFCASDPSDPMVFYGEYVFLNIHRNTDEASSDDTTGDRYISGQFFNTVTGQWDWKQLPFQIPDAKTQRALFIAPFTLDPNDADTMLAGGESLWRTTDVKTANTPTRGPSWTRIKQPAASPGPVRRINGISAVTVAPGDSDRVWVGYEDGQVWRTNDGTAHSPVWSRIDGVGAAPLQTGRFCTQICLTARNPDLVLATFGGYVADNVWRSDDGGSTWTGVGAGLPAAPVRAVTLHPRRPDHVYLGTEVGLFASDDSGASWSATNEGPTSCSVEDLVWSGETLICVTHGRGMFSIDLSGIEDQP
jgi:hypothetical protein